MKRQRITAYFFSIDGNAVTIERIAGHYSLTPLPSLRPSGGTVLCAGLLCRRPSEFLYPPPHCGTREARQILDLGIGEARTNEIADLHLFFSESSEPLCKKIRLTASNTSPALPASSDLWSKLRNDRFCSIFEASISSLLFSSARDCCSCLLMLSSLSFTELISALDAAYWSSAHLFSPWQSPSKLGSAHLAYRKGSAGYRDSKRKLKRECSGLHDR